MGRHKHEKYECPRCGYSTDRKHNMRAHLYANKRGCPATKKPLELTDDIKAKVIENRKYTQEVEKTVGQTVNLHYTYNTIIAGMDAVEKLKQISNYKRVDVLSFENHVEDTYSRTVKRLEGNKFKHDYVLKKSDFLNAINTLTKAIQDSPSSNEEEKNKFLEILNFFYDSKRKRIRVYHSDKWVEYLVEQGVQFLIETMVDYYFATYEKYLLKHLGTYLLENTMDRRMALLETTLHDYYAFISCFEIEPYVFDKTDGEIMDDSNNANHVISDRYTQKFHEIKQTLSQADRKQCQKDIMDILTSNSNHILEELNKEMMKLMKMDETFKGLIMNTQMLCA